MLIEKSREIFPEAMKGQSQSRNNAQLWMSLMVKVKSEIVKKQYCIGAWNIRSMNQSKLDMVKQEMARVNINNLGISKLKWMGRKDLIQMTILSTTMGKNPLEEME